MSLCLLFLGFPYQIDGGNVPVIKILKPDAMFWSRLGLLQVFLHDDPGHGSHRPVAVLILHPDDQTMPGVGYFVVFIVIIKILVLCSKLQPHPKIVL